MKKSPLVLTIIGALCTIASVVLLCLLPQIGGDLNNFVSSNFLSDLFTNLIPALKGTISFAIENAVFSGIIVGLLAVVAIFWIWHFIMLCATRRANSLFINLCWLIMGVASSFVALCYIGYVSPTQAYVFSGTLGSTTFNDGIGLILALNNQGFVDNLTPILLIGGILALAALGYIFCLIGVIGAIHDDRTNPNEKVDEEEEVKAEETPEGEEGANPEANNGEKTQTNVISQPNGPAPLIVQNISYGGMGPMQYQPMPPMPPMPPHEEKKEKHLTEEDVRRILAEILEAQNKAILETLKENKEAEPVKEPVQEEKKELPVEERPLTAKELRSIIKNELRDHDHPEELLPLTDEQCRTLIRNELDEYYAATRPEEEIKETEEKKEEAPVAEQTIEEDFMTADELSKMIRNEVVQVISESPKEEGLTIDEVKQAIKEELGSVEQKPAGVSKEETEELIKKEVSSFDEGKKKQDEAIASIKEQAFKAEYEAKLQAAKNEAALEKLKNSQITADDIRAILSEELDKRLANLEVKKEEPVAKEEPTAPMAAKEEPVIVAPVEPVAPAPVQEANDEAKAERIPFANRLLGLDDEMKEIYNELKTEALSYGLKSRLSVSGDTFRLHTKTYLKIVVAGKGLKLYMALDPHDYKDTTIPVKDAGVKNLYKDIPLVFKVKSPLSVKRAKALIKDACEKDDLKKNENFEPLNYISQLDSYKVAGTATEEED